MIYCKCRVQILLIENSLTIAGSRKGAGGRGGEQAGKWAWVTGLWDLGFPRNWVSEFLHFVFPRACFVPVRFCWNITAKLNETKVSNMQYISERVAQDIWLSNFSTPGPWLMPKCIFTFGFKFAEIFEFQTCSLLQQLALSLFLPLLFHSILRFLVSSIPSFICPSCSEPRVGVLSGLWTL